MNVVSDRGVHHLLRCQGDGMYAHAYRVRKYHTRLQNARKLTACRVE